MLACELDTQQLGNSPISFSLSHLIGKLFAVEQDEMPGPEHIGILDPDDEMQGTNPAPYLIQ